jgi:hypothetical protein
MVGVVGMEDNGLQDQIKAMRDQVNTMRENIESAMKKAQSVKQNMEYDLFKFAIIGFVCVFFGFVIVDSTMKTLSVYFGIKKSESRYNQQFTKPIDEYEYVNFESDLNFKKELVKGINKSQDNQNALLKNAKLEMIASDDRKTGMTPEDYKLDADININSIDKTNDEYKYSVPSKHDKSFLSMLFTNNKAYENA